MEPKDSKHTPQKIAQKCPVCNGFGTLKWGTKTCQACKGLGYVLVPAMDEKERRNEEPTF